MQRSNAVALRDGAELIEQVVIGGDLSRLNPEQRVVYYRQVCESAGLNPLTKPFDYLTLNGKLVLYCNRGGTDQLRLVHGISVTSLVPTLIGDVYVVTASGTTKTGRTDSATGAVPVASLKGEALANAYMKAETKAKRRLTLSLSGLGFLDESEVQSIPMAQRTDVDPETGEILRPRPLAIAAPVSVPQAPSQADLDALHAQFNDAARQVFADDMDPLDDASPHIGSTTGMTTGELFQAAEDAGIPKARLTLSAKSMFGANRWKVTDLSDDERAALWAEVQPR
ncbi:MAG TPA: hypothetical protein VMH41_16935 [Mycobacteriales bacterium]|nr:hypothetical protein [Mycobacteriales bacterium]